MLPQPRQGRKWKTSFNRCLELPDSWSLRGSIMVESCTKGNGGHQRKIFRLVIGNPLIMREMVKHVPDAGSYAPVTILIDERPDGVHISYDRMAGFLAPYENAEALKVAKDLDAKVEALLASAAA